MRPHACQLVAARYCEADKSAMLCETVGAAGVGGLHSHSNRRIGPEHEKDREWLGLWVAAWLDEQLSAPESTQDGPPQQ